MSNMRGGSIIGGYKATHLGNLLNHLKAVLYKGVGSGCGIDVDTVDGKHAGDFQVAGSYAAATHTHTKSQISDFPTSLPANGGNAETLGGHTASYFASTTYADNAAFNEIMALHIRNGEEAYSTIEGNNCRATADAAHAEGYQTWATGYNAHTEGESTHGGAKNSHAEGYNSVAYGQNCHAEGSYTLACIGKIYQIISRNNTAKTLTLDQIEGLTVNSYVMIKAGEEDFYIKSSIYVKITNISNFTITVSTTDSIDHWLYVIQLQTPTVVMSAHSEGTDTLASASYSHAEGLSTISIGEGSHAEGKKTKAINSYSHAEGYNNASNGQSSHTEGEDNSASGLASHAEGDKTTASGNYSHTEGFGTVVGTATPMVLTATSLSCAHAEGNGTKASGNSSHAEGQQTKATANTSHAEGFNNISDGQSSHTEGEDNSASGLASHAEGDNTMATANYSHAEGSGSEANGIGSHAEANSITYGERSHAEGDNTTAEGNYSHVEGTNTHSYGMASHAEGFMTDAYGPNSHAEGCRTRSFDGVCKNVMSYDSGTNSVTIDNITGIFGTITKINVIMSDGTRRFDIPVTSVSGSTLTIVNSITVDGTWSLIIIPGSAESGAHAEGVRTLAVGVASHAEGYNTSSTGINSHAEGVGTAASSEGSHAEGSNCIAGGESSHAEGSVCETQGASSHAEGSNANANGNASHAEGNGTLTEGASSHAEGQGTIASGNYSHTEGLQTKTIGNGSHAEGYTSKAYGLNSHAEGNATASFSDKRYLIVLFDNTAKTITLNQSISSSYVNGKVIIFNSNNEIIGTFTVTTVNTTNKVTLYTGSTAIDSTWLYANFEQPNEVGGYPSHTEGTQTSAFYSSHAEGYKTIAAGLGSHAEGGGISFLNQRRRHLE
jgi:hypothetical protein